MTFAEKIANLYIAVFDRAPDAEGLDYWVHCGMTLEQIAQSFFDQPETQAMYGDQSLEDFITAVYENVLGREPDAAGYDYWYDELADGTMGRQVFILAIINGAMEHEADARYLQGRGEVGMAFVDAGLNDVALAHKVMAMAAMGAARACRHIPNSPFSAHVESPLDVIAPGRSILQVELMSVLFRISLESE